MAVNSFVANQGTQSSLLTDNTGGASGTLIPVYKLSLDAQGTFTPGNIFQGTILQINNIGTLPNLPQGSINVTAGTVSAGTINTGTVNAGTINAATVTAGTINNVGTVPGMGTVTNLGSVTNIGQVYNAGTIQNGSIIVTTGTVNAGTVNTGTMNAGTINTGTVNLGSFVKITAAPSAGSFTAAGSIVQAGSQSDVAAFDLQGTWVGTVFFEAQIGTSSWFGVPAFSNTGVIGTQTTGNGDYFVSMAGLDGARARLTYSSGTLTYNSRTSNFFYPGQFALGGTIGNVGMLNAGTISTLPNIPGGTLNLITTVSNLTNGSVAVTAGTVSAGTINTGTMNAGTVNTGTVNTGTINTGTINAGTINAGTIQLNPLTATNTISNQGTSGTTAIGTLLGTSSIGAGTAVYVTYYNVLGISGTPECTLAFGSQTNGPQVIYHGLIPAGGGIVIQKPYPHGYGTTNSPLTYQINSGAGTVSWSVDYFLHT